MVLKLLPAAIFTLVGCAPAHSPSAFSGRFLGTDNTTHEIVDPNARLTVLEFFAARCPCQTKHDDRLIKLAKRYRSQRVAFYAIDSEFDAALDRDRNEAARRGYPYAILLNPDGSAARALRADYATYSVLLDSKGTVLYRGGLDSDRNRLTPDATLYLEQAIRDVLANRPVARPEAKTLGCSLTLGFQ